LLAEHIAKQPAAFQLDAPWVGLCNYVARCENKNVVASRKWLLGCLDAVQKEGRDDIIKALRALPELK
jgi:hypothetical protein